jgi:hypothetical protein
MMKPRSGIMHLALSFEWQFSVSGMYVYFVNLSGSDNLF